MPTVAIVRDDLFALLEESFTEEEFDRLCFEFGIELDEVTTEAAMARKREAGTEAAADTVIYKIDVPANRYDLLCVEGLAQALRVFLGKDEPPALRMAKPAAAMHRMVVKKDTSRIRPYVVAAVLRNIKLDHARYNSFLDLQDKLHFNICRRRTLVAIGTHDLDTLEGPFTYEALPGDEIRFVPLAQDREFSARELLDWYRDPANADAKHLRPYTDIIYDSPVYPVIYDARRTVLSLPPIINGRHSKISKNTRNCFIECTATDHTKAVIVLNQLVAMFSMYAEEPFTVEPVEVAYEEDPPRIGAGPHVYPDLRPHEMTCSVRQINRLAGIAVDSETACKLLKRMMLVSAPAGGDDVTVSVPVTRADILHECDVVEDVAIAYGYNNIKKVIPQTVCIGKELPVNQLTDLLRYEVAHAGYTETLTLGLCSFEENFTMLGKEVDDTAVVLSNPKTIEFQVARTSLIPGILKTVRENRAQAVKEGMKLFEISDVVLRDASVDVGARNERRVCALYMGLTAGFEVIHGLVDRVMQLLEVAPASGYSGIPYDGPPRREYYIRPFDEPMYFAGRCAQVVLTDPRRAEPLVLGSFGIVHPTVLTNFGLSNPCSIVELCIEPFVHA